MAKKRYRPAEIISKQGEPDIRVGQGCTVAQAIKSIGVSEGSYNHWRQEYGGMTTSQARRLKRVGGGDQSSSQSRLRPDIG